MRTMRAILSALLVVACLAFGANSAAACELPTGGNDLDKLCEGHSSWTSTSSLKDKGCTRSEVERWRQGNRCDGPTPTPTPTPTPAPTPTRTEGDDGYEETELDRAAAKTFATDADDAECELPTGGSNLEKLCALHSSWTGAAQLKERNCKKATVERWQSKKCDPCSPSGGRARRGGDGEKCPLLGQSDESSDESKAKGLFRRGWDKLFGSTREAAHSFGVAFDVAPGVKVPVKAEWNPKEKSLYLASGVTVGVELERFNKMMQDMTGLDLDAKATAGVEAGVKFYVKNAGGAKGEELALQALEVALKAHAAVQLKGKQALGLAAEIKAKGDRNGYYITGKIEFTVAGKVLISREKKVDQQEIDQRVLLLDPESTSSDQRLRRSSTDEVGADAAAVEDNQAIEEETMIEIEIFPADGSSAEDIAAAINEANQEGTLKVPAFRDGKWAQVRPSPAVVVQHSKSNGSGAGAAVVAIVVVLCLLLLGAAGIWWYRCRVSARGSEATAGADAEKRQIVEEAMVGSSSSSSSSSSNNAVRCHHATATVTVKDATVVTITPCAVAPASPSAPAQPHQQQRCAAKRGDGSGCDNYCSGDGGRYCTSHTCPSTGCQSAKPSKADYCQACTSVAA